MELIAMLLFLFLLTFLFMNYWIAMEILLNLLDCNGNIIESIGSYCTPPDFVKFDGICRGLMEFIIGFWNF